MRRALATVGTRRLLAKTCSKCSHLKQAREFTIRANGYHESWCKGCRSRETLAAYHANKKYKERSR